MEEKGDKQQLNIVKLVIVSLVGIFIIGGGFYAAYLYSKRQSGGLVFPGGVTYLGPSPGFTPRAHPEGQEAKGEAIQQPTPTPVRFTAPADVAWNTMYGRIYPYSFSYPSTLTLVVFPGDPADSVAIVWGNIPPQVNLLINMEFIEKRDPKLVAQPKIEYVRNWFKFFSGLKGVDRVDPFTNTNGLKGFKAYYINYANETPNVDVFFEVPNQPATLIHMANGILDPGIFDRIVDSLAWTPTTPTLKSTP